MNNGYGASDKIRKGLTEAVAYARGQVGGARVREVKVPQSIDVHAVRSNLGMSQREFALRFGFSLATVKNWEQGHRMPESSARVLLTVIDREPDAVVRALAVG
ncbi:MAG: helix-turn-helix domain-containing protein [Hyphomicrobiales bacterium]|nr:helix-turn-helix domain-containing protein [Hyphomicrobiales bacterium]